MSEKQPSRIVVFGATGHLGQQLIDRLDESDWPIAELVGVASADSAGLEFDFRGESLDVESEWPVLKGRDLVFVCTPPAEALEIVREALRAEVPCVDCSGSLSKQDEVPLATIGSRGAEETTASLAPLLPIVSGTTLAWLPILESLAVERVVGMVASSASAGGRDGVVALSQESIALFNQEDAPDHGPAGQAVAFDVIPGGGIDCDRVESECRRLLGDATRVAVVSTQVPTFVGEGAWLSLELAEPTSLETVRASLEERDGICVVEDGIGSRGLRVVDEDGVEPIGPTLRDAIGCDEVLVGRIEPDASLPEDRGYRLWLAFDPIRLVADEAIRVGARRLGLA